jgi:hypothetical protein
MLFCRIVAGRLTGQSFSLNRPVYTLSDIDPWRLFGPLFRISHDFFVFHAGKEDERECCLVPEDSFYARLRKRLFDLIPAIPGFLIFVPFHACHREAR